MAETYVPIWMRGTPLEQVSINAWVETGDVQMAREAVRADPAYGQFFPGNVREDGSIRYDEDTYLAITESYGDALLSVGVNPDLFSTRFGELIAGAVSPAEFASRVENVYTRVIDATPEVAQRMDEFYGVGLTTEAILASFMDPDIGTAILEKRIAVSEVAAEASTRNFSLTFDFANRLYEAGTDTASEAARFFSLAENALPTLAVLAARHADPDDDFTLEDFAASEIFGSAAQRRRTRTLLAQERASFTTGSLTGVVGSEGGGLTGLVSQ